MKINNQKIPSKQITFFCEYISSDIVDKIAEANQQISLTKYIQSNEFMWDVHFNEDKVSHVLEGLDFERYKSIDFTNSGSIEENIIFIYDTYKLSLKNHGNGIKTIFYVFNYIFSDCTELYIPDFHTSIHPSLYKRYLNLIINSVNHLNKSIVLSSTSDQLIKNIDKVLINNCDKNKYIDLFVLNLNQNIEKINVEEIKNHPYFNYF